MNTVNALEELFENTGSSVVFSRRGEAIPGDLRLSWRIPMLCMILQRFRGNKAELEHLHTVWWAIRSKETRKLFTRWFEGVKRPDEVIVRFDPSLSITLDLALGQGFIVAPGSGTIELTSAGDELAKSIWLEEGVFEIEKAFLGVLPRKMTQKLIKEITKW